MLLHWHADVQKRGDAWAGLNASKNTSILSFFNFPLDGEDFEDLEGRQAIGWRGPGSLNDCMEQCSLSSTDLLWPYGLSNKPTLLELKAWDLGLFVTAMILHWLMHSSLTDSVLSLSLNFLLSLSCGFSHPFPGFWPPLILGQFFSGYPDTYARGQCFSLVLQGLLGSDRSPLRSKVRRKNRPHLWIEMWAYNSNLSSSVNLLHDCGWLISPLSSIPSSMKYGRQKFHL